ncbi:MAG: HU family DNA-binding protein [Bacteroides sp.]|nr:HU family DNA-binding protein [Bacteroides sp.]
MNNKEFIVELAKQTGSTAKEATERVELLLGIMTQQLEKENSFVIQGFGSFEVKKKLERITVNPVSRQRMLVPPKLVLSYKPSNLLKDKFRQEY